MTRQPNDEEPSPRIGEVLDTPTGWRVTLEGFQVTGVTFSLYQIALLADGPAGERCKIDIESPFTLATADGATFTSGREESWEPQAPLLRLRAASIVSTDVRTDGALHLTFADGAELEVPPDPDFEAWQIVGPGRLMVVCVPGGGEPAVWDESSPRYVCRLKGSPPQS